MADLSTILRSERRGAEEFVFRVPPGWQQGRGAFGGLVFGALANAMLACESEADRALRSFAGEIAGPVLVGDCALHVSELRRGSGISTRTVTLSQQGELLARATGVFGRTRVLDRNWAPPSPIPGGWEAIEPLSVAPPFGPDFAQFFEFRPTGPLPFSNGPEALAAGWIRPVDAGERMGPAEVLACVDAWWPTNFAREEGPRPMATIAFTAQLHSVSKPLVSGRPFFHRAQARVARDGFMLEERELWTEDGELVATNQQTFVMIK